MHIFLNLFDIAVTGLAIRICKTDQISVFGVVELYHPVLEALLF